MNASKPPTETVHIIGAGLAGSEAAWQVASAGVAVVLHEMHPVRMTEAHRTDGERRHPIAAPVSAAH